MAAKTMRERILLAITDRLDAFININTYRSRTAAVARDKVPALIITPISEDIDQMIGGMVERRLTVRINVLERGDIPDSVADPTLALVHAAMMADTSLSGLCNNIEEDHIEWDMEPADLDGIDVQLFYIVTYRTRLNDQTASTFP